MCLVEGVGSRIECEEGWSEFWGILKSMTEIFMWFQICSKFLVGSYEIILNYINNSYSNLFIFNECIKDHYYKARSNTSLAFNFKIIIIITIVIYLKLFTPERYIKLKVNLSN